MDLTVNEQVTVTLKIIILVVKHLKYAREVLNGLQATVQPAQEVSFVQVKGLSNSYEQ